MKGEGIRRLRSELGFAQRVRLPQARVGTRVGAALCGRDARAPKDGFPRP